LPPRREVLGGWKSHGKVTVNSENEH
jgi:hypothetical protein